MEKSERGREADEWTPCVSECEREEEESNLVHTIYGTVCTSVSGLKSYPDVYNGVSQISAEFQWQWHSFLNSNGVFQKR